MKKLRLFQGGHPNSNDDYDHVQEGLTESIAEMVESLLPSGVNRCILNGCAYDGTNLTAGAVYYQGEIYGVAAQALTANVADVWFVIEETVRNNTDVVYLDTVQRSVHIIETMALQAGGGTVKYDTLQRFEALVYDRIDIGGQHYTKAEIDAQFAAFRNGYEPTFRINPTNSHLEWAYANPPHPDATGTGANPWNDLGTPVQYYFGTGGGLFEARINANKAFLPARDVWDIVDFGNEVIDEGNVFFTRKYTIPVSGIYNFVLDQIAVTLVNNAVPLQNFPAGNYYGSRGRFGWDNAKAKLKVGIWKTDTNSVSAQLRNSDVNVVGGNGFQALLELPVWNAGQTRVWGSSESRQEERITDANGTIYTAIPVNFTHNFQAGDEVTVRVSIEVDDYDSVVNLNQDKRPNLRERAAENAAIAYQLSGGKLYTI
ncbi:MAG: hypothetical protein AAF740_09825 [Bacteroidota bacterium]